MKTYQLPTDKIISQLGYLSSNNLFMYNQLESVPLSLHLKRILKEIHPYAVYILDNTPFVLFFDKIINDDISFKEVSRRVWNAQIPVAIFCDESTVKIFNGLSLDLTNDTLRHIETNPIDNCNYNSKFSYWQISNSLFWNQYAENYSKRN